MPTFTNSTTITGSNDVSMERKITPLKSSHQTLSSPKLTIMVAVAVDSYLPDDGWEYVFKFLNDNDNNDRRCLKSIAGVSKQFLSITNRLRFSLKICDEALYFLPLLLGRFTKLISIDLSPYKGDLDKPIYQIASFPLKLTSLNLSNHHILQWDGMRTLSQKITTITSLTYSYIYFRSCTNLFIIADCFPNLQLLDLNNCYDIPEEGIVRVLRRCCNIRHLNLARCSSVTLREMNFKVPKLEELNLSDTRVDDEALCVISKSCCGLLQLSLESCCYVREKGVKLVLMNCTQLRHLNLGWCTNVRLREMNFKVPKLEELNLSYTRVDDLTLCVISKSCCGLLQLSLESCCYVTEKGVKLVVMNCTQLREINLRYCEKVDANIVGKMIFLRPSLRKITAPPGYRFSDKKRKLFSSYGCLVC